VRRPLLLVFLAFFAATALGHGSTPPPGVPKDPGWDDPKIDPDHPYYRGKTDPETGPAPIRPPVREGATTKRMGGGVTWRLFWEYNREYLIGLRQLLRTPGTVTGRAPAADRDPLGARRPEVLAALRETARGASDRVLRSAALIALGRTGEDADARLFLELLQDGDQPRDVHEGAAVGLAILPAIEDAATRRTTAEFLTAVLDGPRALQGRTQGLAVLATGMRARHAPALRMRLLGKLADRDLDNEAAADLMLATGFAGDAMVVPELVQASRKARLGSVKLNDVGRAHALQALALLELPDAVATLNAVLLSRRSAIESRRSAALGLGRLLHDLALDDETAGVARRALTQAFEKENDADLRGYAAIGLGAAREPTGLLVLQTAIDHGGNAAVKPYCALALGLAARTLGEERSKGLRGFLREELGKTHDVELGSSLSIALGLARAHEAADDLAARLGRGSAEVRGAAAEGLGLLGKASDAHVALLREIVRTETSGKLLGDAILALGLLRQRSVVNDLVAKLPDAKSAQLAGRIMLALGHLDHAAAVEPLLKVLGNDKLRPRVREFACVALGLLGDRREHDLLFDLDAFFNLNALTRATGELIRLY